MSTARRESKRNQCVFRSRLVRLGTHSRPSINENEWKILNMNDVAIQQYTANDRTDNMKMMDASRCVRRTQRTKQKTRK